MPPLQKPRTPVSHNPQRAAARPAQNALRQSTSRNALFEPTAAPRLPRPGKPVPLSRPARCRPALFVPGGPLLPRAQPAPSSAPSLRRLPSADSTLHWRPFLAPAVRRRLTAASLTRAGTPARLPRLCCRCVCCVCTVASLAWFRLLLLPRVLPCGSSTCAGSICIRVELPARPEPS